MTYLESQRIVKRVIAETAGTIATQGIQELDHNERGGVSTFSFVVGCILATAYSGVRSMPGFNMSVNEFYKAVESV